MSDDAAIKLLADSINNLANDLRADRKTAQTELRILHERADKQAAKLEEAICALQSRIDDKASNDDLAALQMTCTGTKRHETDRHHRGGLWSALGRAVLANPLALMLSLLLVLVLAGFAVFVYVVITGQPASNLNPMGGNPS